MRERASGRGHRGTPHLKCAIICGAAIFKEEGRGSAAPKGANGFFIVILRLGLSVASCYGFHRVCL